MGKYADSVEQYKKYVTINPATPRFISRWDTPTTSQASWTRHRVLRESLDHQPPSRGRLRDPGKRLFQTGTIRGGDYPVSAGLEVESP